MAVVIVPICLLYLNIYSYIQWERKITNFDIYKSDFQFIVNEMTYLAEQNLNNDDFISIIYDTDIRAEINNDITSQPLKLSLSTTIKDALKNIDKAFDEKDNLFKRLLIYKDRITFSTEGNLYAIIYTADNSKPQFMNIATEQFSIKTKMIEKCWYHVISK